MDVNMVKLHWLQIHSGNDGRIVDSWHLTCYIFMILLCPDSQFTLTSSGAEMYSAQTYSDSYTVVK